MHDFKSDPSVWMYITLVIGLLTAPIAIFHVEDLEKHIVGLISRISLSICVVLAGIFQIGDSGTAAIVVILGLAVIWFGVGFVQYHRQDREETPQAQLHS